MASSVSTPLPALDASTRRLAVLGIEFYQKRLSPHKGFSCAHRVLHQGLSCSEFIRRAILENNWREAIGVSRQRLDECRTAAWRLRQIALQSDSPFKPLPGAPHGDEQTNEREENGREEKEKPERDCSGGDPGCDPGFDCCLHLPLDLACDAWPAHTLPCDALPCDVLPCDVCACWW